MKNSKRKKWACGILFSVLVTGIGNICLAEPIFTDVNEGNYYYVPVKYLKENGMIDGYEDGSFSPYREINRAEALKMLSKALPKTSSTDPSDFFFADVSPLSWYYPFVVSAWNDKVISGYPDGLFHPEKTINRAEALKVALLFNREQLPETVESPPYSDVPVTEWYAPFALLSKNKTLFLMDRSTGNLNPESNMNRGDFAQLIYRLIKSRENTSFVRTTWYGDEDVNWGTASGERFNVNSFTAAHKTLPFGTKLLVTNEANGKSVEVRVNDRGPYARGVDLDLTRSAFEQIASIGTGIIVTEFTIISEPAGKTISENTLPQSNVEYGF